MNDSESPSKLRVVLLYGGRSTEHEVSLESASAVLRHLDATRYEIVPVYVDPHGTFHRQHLLVDPTEPARQLPMVTAHGGSSSLAATKLLAADSGDTPLVVFPVMHGPLCEDGSLQGMLELAEVAYVGARVLGSAVGMDKDVAKRLVRAAGMPVVPYLCVRGPSYEAAADAWLERIERELSLPMFVKPATLGSSVGVSKATTRAELADAIALALRYDDKLLVEKAIRAREIELAVLAARALGAPPDVSVPGEIRPRDADFYTFERKYLDAEGAELEVPAQLDPALAQAARETAREIFLALECEGMARVDFFLEEDSGQLLFNEINTIPGFTGLSMYPKLWEASGVSYRELLDRLLSDAVSRHARRTRLSRQRVL